MSGLYVDTSALVKTLVPEAESEALVAVLDATSPLLTSEVASTELRRVARWAGVATERVQRRLAQLDRLPATREILVAAGGLPDPVEPLGTRLGSLDAVHLASALRAGADRIATYDRNQSRAARAAGLTVLHPGRPADWFV